MGAEVSHWIEIIHGVHTVLGGGHDPLRIHNRLSYPHTSPALTGTQAMLKVGVGCVDQRNPSQQNWSLLRFFLAKQHACSCFQKVEKYASQISSSPQAYFQKCLKTTNHQSRARKYIHSFRKKKKTDSCTLFGIHLYRDWEAVGVHHKLPNIKPTSEVKEFPPQPYLSWRWFHCLVRVQNGKLSERKTSDGSEIQKNLRNFQPHNFWVMVFHRKNTCVGIEAVLFNEICVSVSQNEGS